MPEIKLCPFCGQDARLTKEHPEGCCQHGDSNKLWHYYVECLCGARGAWHVNRDVAIREWNRRADPPQPAPRRLTDAGEGT